VVADSSVMKKGHFVGAFVSFFPVTTKQFNQSETEKI